MKNRAGLRAFVGVVCAAFALPALAQNLLQNPHFDGTLNPWTTFDAFYDADHSATADGTGSAAVSEPVGGTVLQQCVSGIVPGATYSFGGTMRIPSTSAPGLAEIDLHWHAASNCSDGILDFAALQFTNPPGPTDSWEKFSGTSVAPPGATAASLSVFVEEGEGGEASAPKARREAVATFVVSIDDLFLDPPPPIIVPTLGGVGIAVLLVSLAGAALFLLRR